MRDWLKRGSEYISGIVGRVVDVVCPDVCTVCGRRLVDTEKVICTVCLLDMPVTEIHHGGFTSIHERVASTRFMVDRAAAMMWYFRDSGYSRLIHDAKYNHRPGVAAYLARTYARSLVGKGFFDGVDVIIPVPLHFTKFISRGYNQAEVIADAIGEMTGIKVLDNIYCRRAHSTQTRKGIAARDANARDTYMIERPEELDGKHVLIVDDVITTGATMRACLELLSTHCRGIRMSILALAAARLQ